MHKSMHITHESVQLWLNSSFISPDSQSVWRGGRHLQMLCYQWIWQGYLHSSIECNWGWECLFLYSSYNLLVWSVESLYFGGNPKHLLLVGFKKKKAMEQLEDIGGYFHSFIHPWLKFFLNYKRVFGEGDFSIRGLIFFTCSLKKQHCLWKPFFLLWKHI